MASSFLLRMGAIGVYYENAGGSNHRRRDAEIYAASEDVWTDAARSEFMDYIARNPEAGDVIPETSGCRKVRWRRQGTGKRGGVRVIYFYHDQARPLFLLMVYAKTVRENVAPEAKKAFAEFAARIKRAGRG